MDLLHSLAVLTTYLALSAAVRPPNARQSSQSSSSSPSLETRVNKLEQTQKRLKRKVTSLTVQRDSLEERLLAIEKRLAAQDDLTTVEQLLLEKKNQELTRMLGHFERFFGSLYAETPESFDPMTGVDVRLSNLNSYLGNREAELLSLRPAPLKMVSDATVNQDLLVKALYDSEQERNNMDRKLRRLEENLERVASRVPAHPRARMTEGTLIDEDVWDHFTPAVDDNGSPGQRGQSVSQRNADNGNGGGMSMPIRSIDATSSASDVSDSNINNNEIIDRLALLEDLMALQLLSFVNETLLGQQVSDRAGGSSSSVLANLTQMQVLEEAVSALRASRPDCKKVAFSVAKTTHLLGESYPQILDFDHMFSNKGGDFNMANSTFMCAVTGFYLVSFT